MLQGRDYLIPTYVAFKGNNAPIHVELLVALCISLTRGEAELRRMMALMSSVTIESMPRPRFQGFTIQTLGTALQTIVKNNSGHDAVRLYMSSQSYISTRLYISQNECECLQGRNMCTTYRPTMQCAMCVRITSLPVGSTPSPSVAAHTAG